MVSLQQNPEHSRKIEDTLLPLLAGEKNLKNALHVLNK